ncbi:hypothetical protein Tco_1119548, partial [Tanacetum coccineum]
TSSSYRVVNIAHGVTTASTQATAINLTTIDSLSDAVICAFFARHGDILEETLERKLNVNVGLGDFDWSVKQKKSKLLCTMLTLYQVITSESLGEVAIIKLRKKLELAQKQKDEIQLTVENFENSSKNLSKLLDCQIVDKCKICLGYNAVPPPYTRNFMPPKHDLSSLEEFVNEPIVSEPTIKKPIVEISKAKVSADNPKAVKKNNGAPIIKDWVSDSEEEDVPQAKKEKKTIKSSFAKIEFVKSKEQVKSPRKTVNHVNQNRQNTQTCYVCGSFDHLQYDCDNHRRQFNNNKMVKLVWNYTQRVNHQNFARITHPSPKRNLVPKAVLMRFGLVSLTTARPVNNAQPKTTVNSARPMINVFNKAHSTVRMPINNKTTTKNSNKRVNTVSGKNVNTARPKAAVNAARPKAVLNAIKGNQVNAVKASTCWV